MGGLARKAKMRRALAKAMRHRKLESKKAEAAPAGDEAPLAAGAGDTPIAEEPEAVPEASEAALWPEAGVKVAVGGGASAAFLEAR